MAQYKYGSVMRQIDEDPSGSMEKGTIWIKAGDQSDGDARTVIDEEVGGFVDVQSEAIAVYEGDHRMNQKEAEQLAIQRSKEEDLMEEYDGG